MIGYCLVKTTTSKNVWFHRHRPHKLTSPVLQAEEVVEVVADERRDLLQVVGSNPGGQERLVGISEGGVHQQQTFVGAHGLGESLGTVTQEHVAETHWRLACGEESKGGASEKCAEKGNMCLVTSGKGSTVLKVPPMPVSLSRKSSVGE